MNTPVSESKPVRTLYAISAGALVVAAGLPLLTPDQFDWIGPALGLVGAALVAGLGKFTEGKVRPVENVEATVHTTDSGERLVLAGEGSEIPTGAPVTVEPTTAFGAPFDTTPPQNGH
jgi:hypothetical protein